MGGSNTLYNLFTLYILYTLYILFTLYILYPLHSSYTLYTLNTLYKLTQGKRESSQRPEVNKESAKNKKGQREKIGSFFCDPIPQATRPRARTHARTARHEMMSRLGSPPTSDYVFDRLSMVTGSRLMAHGQRAGPLGHEP